jgi:hypothetical protein
MKIFTGHSYFRKAAALQYAMHSTKGMNQKWLTSLGAKLFQMARKFKMMSGGCLRMIKARNSTNMAKKEQVTVVSTSGSF